MLIVSERNPLRLKRGEAGGNADAEGEYDIGEREDDSENEERLSQKNKNKKSGRGIECLERSM
jgi:hypothetical protein